MKAKQLKKQEEEKNYTESFKAIGQQNIQDSKAAQEKKIAHLRPSSGNQLNKPVIPKSSDENQTAKASMGGFSGANQYNASPGSMKQLYFKIKDYIIENQFKKKMLLRRSGEGIKDF